MDRSKIIAIVTGVISLLLAIAYLLLVQILDFRGDMQPAPLSQVSQSPYALSSPDLNAKPLIDII